MQKEMPSSVELGVSAIGDDDRLACLAAVVVAAVRSSNRDYNDCRGDAGGDKPTVTSPEASRGCTSSASWWQSWLRRRRCFRRRRRRGWLLHRSATARTATSAAGLRK